jgi:hypothetical protein
MTYRYGRVLSRVKKDPYAVKVLQWIACAKTPLTVAQLRQALLVKPGMLDFGERNMAILDIRRNCGPIIEVENGKVRLAHFTVYE